MLRGSSGLLLTICVLVLAIFASAQQAEYVQKPLVECLVQAGQCAEVEAGLSNEITIRLSGLSNGNIIIESQKQVDPWKLILYLNERPIRGVYPIAVVTTKETAQIVYRLTRTPDSKDTWSALLAADKRKHDVRVSVGLDGGEPFPAGAESHFKLVVVRLGWQLWALAAVMVLMLGALFFIPNIQEMFRESGPLDDNSDQKRAYSLAKCQMGFWFFVVLFSYIFIWLITWDRDVLPVEVLGLLGISATTFLAAAAIDSSKAQDAKSSIDQISNEIRSLEEQMSSLRQQNPIPQPTVDGLSIQLATKQSTLQKLRSQIHAPAHESILSDLLTDINGYSFHRFQIVTWTLVLGIIFLNSVWGNLSMPVFSSTLLGLMGISNGTYIGFKFPEQKS